MFTNLEKNLNEFSKTSKWRSISLDSMYFEQSLTDQVFPLWQTVKVWLKGK